MESKPVLNVKLVTRNQDKAGFMCEYLTEGEGTHTKHLAPAADVVIVDDHLGPSCW